MASSLSKNANYPSGVFVNTATGTASITPSNGGTVLANGTQVTATIKKYGPNLSETQGKQVDQTQQSATKLTCDGTNGIGATGQGITNGNNVKNSQNYGPGETKHAIESPGTGQNGTSGQVGQGGATFGQPAGYSIKGD